MSENEAVKIVCEFVDRLKKSSGKIDLDGFLAEFEIKEKQKILPLLEAAVLLEQGARLLKDARHRDQIEDLTKPWTVDEFLEAINLEMEDPAFRKLHEPVEVLEAAEELIGSTDPRFLFEYLTEMGEEDREQVIDDLMRRAKEIRNKKEKPGKMD